MVGDVAEEVVGDAVLGHTPRSLRCAYEGLQLWVTHTRVWTPPRESSLQVFHAGLVKLKLPSENSIVTRHAIFM